MSECTKKVLIIGGGLGGLVLAQILHANNIPFEIFERDHNLDLDRQGWAVGLSEAIPDLQRTLPGEITNSLPTLSVNYPIKVGDEFGFVDALTGAKLGSMGGVPPGEPGYILRLRRKDLRAHLWNSNNLSMTLGKKFTHYEEDEDGVTAFFADGNKAHGAILVGADGAHSLVREQLLGAAQQPVLSKWVPIFGRSSVPESVHESLQDLGNAFIVARVPGTRLTIGLMHIEPDGKHAEYYWCVMSRYTVPSECKEMSNWVIHQANKQELFDKALHILEHAGFASKLIACVRKGGVGGVFKPQPAFIEYYAPDSLSNGRVTLLGDAAHTMIPFRAAGANTAVKDACDLGRLLVGKGLSSKKFELAALLQEYNKTMLPRGREMVLSSREAGETGEV